MSLKISFRLLLQLVVLLAAFLAQSSEGATFRDFTNRHIDSGRPGGNLGTYCNRIMRQRGMSTRRCKPRNTFIHERSGNIQSVCGTGGTPAHRNLRDSRGAFLLTECRSTGRFPNCNYRGRQMRRRVRLACVRSLPVHFDRML